MGDFREVAEAVVAGGLREGLDLFVGTLLGHCVQVTEARLGDLADLQLLTGLRAMGDVGQIANSGESVQGKA